MQRPRNAFFESYKTLKFDLCNSLKVLENCFNVCASPNTSCYGFKDPYSFLIGHSEWHLNKFWMFTLFVFLQTTVAP